MNLAYEMLIIVTLIVATLVVAQGFESGGSVDRPNIVQVSYTPN